MTIILGAIGAAAGSAIPGVGWALGWSIGTTLGSVIDASKMRPNAQTLNDLKVSGSSYNSPIPLVYGGWELAGNIIWAGDLTSEDAGGSKKTPDEVSYSCSLAIAVCEGPVFSVTKIWADDLLIYDDGDTEETITIYLGDEAQVADPLIESLEGVGSVPGYRGICYVVLEAMSLQKYGNRIPNFRFLIEQTVTTETVFADVERNQAVAFVKPDDTFWGGGLMPGLNGGAAFQTVTQVASNVALGSVGAGVTCYIDSAGDYYATGDNTQGQFANGAHTGTRTAFATSANVGTTCTQLWSGVTNSALVKANGSLHFLGATGAVGVRGDGSTTRVDAWTQVVASGVAFTWGQDATRLYVSTAKDLFVTGINTDGLFGRGNTTNLTSFTEVTAVHGVCEKAIFSTDNSSGGAMLVLKSDGTVWCAGNNTYNAFGNLALGTSYTSSSLVQVPGLTDIVDIAAGTGWFIAINSTGDVYTWGKNNDYAVGHGTINTAVDVALVLSDCKGIVAGYVGLMAIKNDDTVYACGTPLNYAWGDNSVTALTSFTLLSWSVSSQTVTTADILTSIFGKVGLAASDYDVSAATDAIDGFVIADRQSAGSAIAPLLKWQFTDLPEIDGQLVAVVRGGAVVATIDEDDLGAHIVGSEPPDKVSQKYLNILELPAQVDVGYFTLNRHYESASQSAQRFVKDVEGLVSLNFPVASGEDTARQRAETFIYAAWLEQPFQIALPPRYMRLAPSDPIYVPVNGTNVRCRIERADQAMFGPLLLSLVIDDPNIYTQYVLGAPINDQGEMVFTTPPTYFFIWSGNNPTDDDVHVWPATFGLYIAATGAHGWPGCTVLVPYGSNSARKRITDPATMGITSSILGTPNPASTALWDRASYVDVTMYHGTPETVAESEVLDGANLAIVGDELIHFATVTSLGNSSYRLSNLLRGARGTESFWSTHAVGDRFVLIDDKVAYMTLPSSRWQQTLAAKAVALGTTEGDPTNPTQSVTVSGRDLEPYAVCDVRGARALDGAITITWKRRTRAGGDWADGMDVPLSEATEAYSIDVMSGSTVLRTLTATSQTVDYTAAQQVTDFGAVQSSLVVRVYQLGINGVFRGYVSQATI